MRLTKLFHKEAHDEGVWGVSWVPGSSELLSGSVDETVKLWDVTNEDMKMQHTYTGHVLGVISIIVDTTGTYAATSALDSFIRVWNLKDNKTCAVIDTPPTETWAIAFAPFSDPIQIASAGGSSGKVLLHTITTSSNDESAVEQTELLLPQASEDSKHKREKFVLSVAYSPDGSKLACGAMDGTVAVFDLASQKLLGKLSGHYKPIRSLTFTPDSKMLLTACDDMHCHLYDMENNSLIDSFSGHESWVLSVACHPDGQCFASGSSDSKVKLWELRSRACLHTVSDHTDQVWSVAFHPDGSRFASASDDKLVSVYSVA